MIKSCLAKIGCLTVVVLVAAAAWLFRDEIGRAIGRLDVGEGSRPSEALARRADEKLAGLARGSAGEVRFSEPELQSLLVYRVAPMLPAGIERPQVEVRDSTLVLSAFVRADSVGGYVAPDVIRSILADSSRVVVELVPGVFRPGVGRLRVAALQAGGVPVPTLMVPFLTRNLEIPGVEVAGTMLLVALPDGVKGLRVADGALVAETEPESGGG
jgi:hypothetical protein